MKLNTVLLAAVSVLGLAGSASAAVYSGNGASGFGTPLGGGNITITDDGTTAFFTFNAGGPNNDFVMLYIDSIAGGLPNTAGINDFGDPNRSAISAGSAINFASGFNADYAISTRQPAGGGFAGLWGLISPAGNNQLPFVSSANIAGTQQVVTFNVPLASLGVSPGGSFRFVAAYSNGGGYLSNESIGTSVAGGTLDGNGNPGNDGTLTFSDFRTYDVPEPMAASLVALGALGMLRRRK